MLRFWLLVHDSAKAVAQRCPWVRSQSRCGVFGTGGVRMQRTGHDSLAGGLGRLASSPLRTDSQPISTGLLPQPTQSHHQSATEIR